MAIQQMQVIGPRAEQREPQEKKKDWMERLIEGLQIAKGVTGIASDVETIKKNRFEKRGLTGPQLANAQASGLQEVAVDTPGATKYQVIGEDGEERTTALQKMVKPETAKSPTLAWVEGMRGGKPGKILYRDGVATDTFEAAPPKAVGGGTGPNGAGGKKVSGEVAQNIGKYDAAMAQIDSLESDWLGKTGTWSGMMQYLPGTDAAQYSDAQKLAAQNVGQIIEGGKLTDTDFDRYLGMMPTAGDSEERAAEKFKRLREYIAERKTSSVDGAHQAGYDVSGFTPPVVKEGKLKGSPSGKAIAAPSSAPPRPLSKGHKEGGYEFLGGDPGDPNNWKKAK